MKRRLLLFVFATASLAACAQFGRLDSNDDSRISRQEAESSTEISAYFGRFDENQDGYLDRTEFDGALEFIRAKETSTRDRDRHNGHAH